MKHLLCLLALGIGANAQTLTCSTGPNCSAYSGQTITITSSAPTTFTLTGGGTCTGCGTAGTTSVTYTAPTGLIPQNQLLGCPVLPNDTIFNQRIDNASFPLDPNSTTKTGNLSASGLVFQPSWGTTYADSSTPLRAAPYLAYYNSVSYPNFPVQPSQSLLIRESGNKTGALNMPGVDQHIQTVNRSSCVFYETYKDYLSGYTQTCHDGITSGCNVQSATSYASTAYTFPSSSGYDNGTDAAGLPLASLTLHLDEVKAAANGIGAINHATRFTEASQPGPIIWPASPVSGTTSTTNIVYGDRLRLKSSFSIPSVCGSSPAAGSAASVCTAILTAHKQYGRIFADTGSSNADTANQDLWSDPAVYAGLQLITAGNIQPSNYEVVNEQSLESAANSYRVVSQSYATPINQVTVSGSGGGSVAVALQPVAIGSTLYTSLYAEAGSYSVNLAPFIWVNPSTVSQTLAWGESTSNCTGSSISGSGVLTMPSSCSGSGGSGNLLITATSSYDTAAVKYFYITVLPTGTNPANSVRIDSGKTSITTDPGTGYLWQADLGMLGMVSQTGSDNPWPQSPDPLIYQSDDGAYTNDLHTQMLVPNGNYQVHLLFGFLHQGGGCNNAPCGTWPTTLPPNYYPLLNYLPIWAETQGNTVLNNYDWGWATGYLYTTPTSVYLPATVTNNLLEVGLGAYAPDSGPYYSGANYGVSGNKYPQINGIEVLPDSTPAYLSIDPAANQNTQMMISPGTSSSPIYAVPHYFTGGTTTWSILSNSSGVSATLSSDGWGDGGEVLTLGSPASGVTVYAGQQIQVTAANGSYTSSPLTIYTVGSKYPINPKPLVNHYAYVRSITIHHGQVSSAQTNFPVLVSVTDSTLATTSNGGNVQNTKGYDIVFASNSSGTPTLIPWEVESYNAATGNLIAHVLISSLSATTDTVIYMFYGNNSVVSTQNTGSAVWNSTFTSVYHFSSTAGGLSLNDSTSYGRNLQATSPSPSSAPGFIGLGVNGFSSGTLLTIPASTVSQSSGTIEGWINTSLAQTQTWDAFSTNDGTSPSLVWMFNHPYNSGVDFGWAGSGSIITVPFSSISTPVNTWHHIAYTYNGSTQNVYLDGVSVYSVPSGVTTYIPTQRPVIGTYPPSAGYYFQGTLDEMRFSNVPQTAGWIQTEFNSYGSPSTFFTLGSQTAN